MNIKQIKEGIENKQMSVYGWKMRIIQIEEDIFTLQKRLEEFKPILIMHEDDLKNLNILLNERCVKLKSRCRKENEGVKT